ncbi:hypothetical protein WJX73_002544 [Symbiochloris irregularis]|uniref:Cupin type-1 domain-containing protein n=1 Tax=Symbiochloris irregularis TaxID=706552 RepID=A0AAW1NTG9_9CHLO
MFPFSHFHSNVHEALGIFRGSALLQFGGDADAAVQEDVSAGDLIVIPAGVAHKQVEAKGNFMMVGAYPKGAPSWDCFKGEGGEQEWQQAMASIKRTRMPDQDPVFGSDPKAPLFEHWQQSGR